MKSVSSIPQVQDITMEEEDTEEKLLHDILVFADSYLSRHTREHKEQLLENLFHESVGENPGSSSLIAHSKETSVEQRTEVKGVRKKGMHLLSFCLLLFLILTFIPFLILIVSKDNEVYAYIEHSSLRQSLMSEDMYSHIRQNFFYILLYKPLRLLGIYLNLPKEAFYSNIGLTKHCLINNPFTRDRDTDDSDGPCYCNGVNKLMTPKLLLFEEENQDQAAVDPILHLTQPIIIRGKGRNISEADLEEQLSRYGIYLKEAQYFFSSIETVKSMEDLARPQTLHKVLEDAHTHIMWSAAHLMRTSIIRRLFPLNILNGTYFYNTRVLFLDGSDSISYNIPKEVTQGGNIAVYAQGWGSRRILLIPKRKCRTTCVILITNVKKGDILSYNSQIWDLRSEPQEGTSSLASLAFVHSQRIPKE